MSSFVHDLCPCLEYTQACRLCHRGSPSSQHGTCHTTDALSICESCLQDGDRRNGLCGKSNPACHRPAALPGFPCWLWFVLSSFHGRETTGFPFHIQSWLLISQTYSCDQRCGVTAPLLLEENRQWCQAFCRWVVAAEMYKCRDIFLNQKDGVAVSWLPGRYLKVLGANLVLHFGVPSTVGCMRGNKGAHRVSLLSWYFLQKSSKGFCVLSLTTAPL